MRLVSYSSDMAFNQVRPVQCPHSYGFAATGPLNLAILKPRPRRRSAAAPIPGIPIPGRLTIRAGIPNARSSTESKHRFPDFEEWVIFRITKRT